MGFKMKGCWYRNRFLHGELKGNSYMGIPQGMEADKNKCIILKKAIYRLVQSAT